MKKITTAALLIVSLLCIKVSAQSFLKTYASPFSSTTPISFECITEKTDAAGARYIGGHVRDTIMIFKTDNNGGLIQMYRLYKIPANSRLDGIILDSRGDLVVIGNYENTGVFRAFVFKYTPAAATTVWYRETGVNDGLAFTDIIEKAGGANPIYYVSGQSFQNSLVRGLILQVNGTTEL